jgi:hypothetical protein
MASAPCYGSVAATSKLLRPNSRSNQANRPVQTRRDENRPLRSIPCERLALHAQNQCGGFTIVNPPAAASTSRRAIWITRCLVVHASLYLCCATTGSNPADINDRPDESRGSAGHSAATKHQTRKTLAERVFLEVTVEQYSSSPSYDHYVDGTVHERTSTMLRVDAPDRYTGRKILIMHWDPPDPNGPWTNQGGKYTIRMSQRDLQIQPGGGREIGPAAVEWLHGPAGE